MIKNITFAFLTALEMNNTETITCLNCGKSFETDYAFCPYCGQANKKNDLSFKYVLSEFLSANFNLDAKIFITLQLLLFSPGKLTRDYLDGKHMRYISPIRLYLLVSLIYFFLLSVIPGQTEKNTTQLNSQQTVHLQEKNESSDRTTVETGLATSDTLSGLAKLIVTKSNRLTTEEGKKNFWQNMRKNISTGMLVMLPFTALLLYLLFYRNSYYFEHLIFIIHLQTLWFIISGVYILLHLVFHWKILFYIELIVVLAATFLWFKRFYRKSTGKTVWKMFLFFMAFGLLIAFFFSVVTLISLLFL